MLHVLDWLESRSSADPGTQANQMAILLPEQSPTSSKLFIWECSMVCHIDTYWGTSPTKEKRFESLNSAWTWRQLSRTCWNTTMRCCSRCRWHENVTWKRNSSNESGWLRRSMLLTPHISISSVVCPLLTRTDTRTWYCKCRAALCSGIKFHVCTVECEDAKMPEDQCAA
jgi:hypothetical protein